MDRRDILKTTGGAAAAVATSAGATMAAAGTDAKSSVAAAPAVHSATTELRVAFNWPDNSADPTLAAVEDPAGTRNSGLFGRQYRPHGIPHLRVNRNGQNEPVAPLEVTFSFQMNRPKDVVKVDYMTREMINVVVEARLYDAHTNAPQSTSLAQKVKVRNLQR